MKRTEYRYSRAYTLAEMLFVMGLLSILMGVGVVEGSRMLRRGRQAALDKMAETLYVAVQRNLTAAKLAGETIDTTGCDAYQETERLRNQLTLERSDGQWNAVNALNAAPVYRLWAGHSPESLEAILFQTYTDTSTGSVKSALNPEFIGGNWMIGFDPSGYSVFYVYFSPKDGDKQDSYFQSLRGLAEMDDELEKLTSAAYRVESGALIGYYGEPRRDDAPLDVPRKLAYIASPAPANPNPGDPGGSPDEPLESLPRPEDTVTKETPFNTPGDTVTKETPFNTPGERAREINVSKKLYCWIGCGDSPDEPIANAETLATRLNCWVPGDGSAFATGIGPVDVNFTFTVRGVSSMKTAVFRYRMSRFGVYTRKAGSAYTGFVPGDFCQAGTFHGENGWYYRYPVILDSLTDEGDAAALHQDRPFRKRFGGYGLIPGEDLMLRFEVDADESVKQAAMTASYEALTAYDSLINLAADYLPVSVDQLSESDGQYDWLWRVHRPGWNEYPVCNSLFADAGADESGYRSPVRGDGGYVAGIAYGRHLRNLDASVSGIGTDENIRAVQVRDIDFLDSPDAFAPITNPKLSAYDGGGHSVSNPRIVLTDGADAVGLFGILRGDGAFTLSDIELRRPVIVAENLSGIDVGAFIGRAEKPVTLRNLTLTDPEIRTATAANVGGVIGRTAADIVADNLKAVNLSLTAAANIGGLIGLAGANVTLSGAVVENPKLVGGAGAMVGGLVGAASGDGCQVTILSGQLFMPESGDADRELADVLDKWLSGGECAGGLIGYAAGNVTIGRADDGAPSFAATVVNANACAGGLAGRVDGALSVDYAWADCYVKAANIGGLAGQCGEDSAFSHCYAAGFALSDNANAVAAGFAPNAARSIRDAYSAFNFDGLPADATRYGLAESSRESPVNAFYACGGDVGGVGQAVDRDSLKRQTIDGFQTGANPVTNLYRLTREDFDTPYPFPTLAGQDSHYNDYFVTVYEPAAGDSSAPSDEPDTGDSSSPSGEPAAGDSSAPSDEPDAGDSSAPSDEPDTGDSSSPSGEPAAGDSSAPSGEPAAGDSPSPSDEPDTGDSSSPSGEPDTGDSSSPSGEPAAGDTSSPPDDIPIPPNVMEIYIQRPTDDWRKNTNVETYTNLPDGALLGDAAQTAADSRYNDESRDRLYDLYKTYHVDAQSVDARGAVNRDTYQDLLSEFFALSDAGERFASDAYLYGTDDGENAGKLKCRQLYLNDAKSGIAGDSGGMVYRLYFDRNVVSFKFVREAEYFQIGQSVFWDYDLETPEVLSQIYGLYEGPLADGDFNAAYGWLVYPMDSDNEKVIPDTETGRLNNEQLMTLDRFSYDAWETYELEHPDAGPYAGLYLSSCLRAAG